MDRYRIVTQQNDGVPHVSSVVLAKEEIVGFLAQEALLHTMSGWTIEPMADSLVCRKGGVVRVLSAKRTTPFDDVI